jgi:hypothetical protein
MQLAASGLREIQAEAAKILGGEEKADAGDGLTSAERQLKAQLEYLVESVTVVPRR